MTPTTPLTPSRAGDPTAAPQPTMPRRGFLGAASASALLAACGGGSSGDGTVPAPAIRPLPAAFTARKAVAYSPFRTATSDAGRAGETITAAMVLQDLQLLIGAGFGLIRLFDSSDKVAKLTLQVIRDNALDMKVMLGIYVLAGDGAATNAEIARGIALANAFPDTVLAVSVGNETMVSWSFNRYVSTTMAAHLRTVRAAVAQPVTTDDNWAFFAQAYPYEQDPGAVLDTVDFVSMHTYPLLDSVFAPDLWDWRQAAVPEAQRAVAMMDAAVARSRYEYGQVRAHLDALGFGGLPIIIGETGWKADPTTVVGRAHPVNQKMYLDRLAAWKAAGTGPKTIVYFEAFDEPWKQGDDKWGLFNVARQARYAIQDLTPAAIWESGTYTAADAAYVKGLKVRAAVTAPRYTLYADTVTAGELRPLVTGWNAWENNTTATVAEVSGAAPAGDPALSLVLTPTPLSWGWGDTIGLPDNTADDLSAFAAGTLNFSVRTTYPGKLEVGFYVGSVTDGSAYDCYIALSSGDFGFVADGNWHAVSIPIATIRQTVAAKDGVALTRLDLGRITNPFVIADRYAVTGKAAGSNVRDAIALDAIYWAK